MFSGVRYDMIMGKDHNPAKKFMIGGIPTHASYYA